MPKYEIVLHLGNSDHGKKKDFNLERLNDSLQRYRAVATIGVADDFSAVTLTTRKVSLREYHALVQMAEAVPAVTYIESGTVRAMRMARRGKKK